MENEQTQNASIESEESSLETSTNGEAEPEQANQAEKDKKTHEKQLQESCTELEILKNLVRLITNNLNRNAVKPQKAIAIYGSSNQEKMENLAAEAVKSFREAQELPPKAAKILEKAEEEQKSGYSLKDCFQTVAIITLSENVEVNRRLTSANKGDIEDNKDSIENKIFPEVKSLIRRVYSSQAFHSDAMCNFAANMEPTNIEHITKEELKKLENDVSWIITQLWGKTAANLWQLIIAQCEQRQERNSRSGQRITILTHLWNLRFKAILERPTEERNLGNAIERDICKSISEAMYGQLLQMLRNTRCINSELATNAARSAKTNLDAIFSTANPLSQVLGKFLANADSNPEFTNWEAIRIIRSLWPARDQIGSSEYAILSLNGIDNRIESGLQSPETLANTNYEKYFVKRSYATSYTQGKKRRRETIESGWGENLGGNSSRSNERETGWNL